MDAHPAVVLLVDGDEARADPSATILSRHGHTVVVAHTGAEGLRQARSLPVDAAIVAPELSDMPVLEVLRALKAHDPEMRLIILAPPGQEDFEIEALRAGAVESVLLTARFHEFLPKLVEELVETARTRRRLSEMRTRHAAGLAETKRARERLHESEALLRLALSQAPLVLWTVGPDLRFTSSLGAGLASMDADPLLFVGRAVDEVFPADVPEGPRELHRRALDGESVRTEFGWADRWYDLRLEPLRSPEGAVLGVIGAAVDITDRKRTGDALRVAEAKFRGLVEQSLVGTYIIQDDRFVYVNPTLAEIFGYTPEEIVSSKTVADLVAPEDRDRVMRNIDRRIRGDETSLRYGFHGIRKDGRVIAVDVHGTKMDHGGRPAIIGSLLDVTERERAEDDLRKSEGRFRALFETAADAIVLCNPDGAILDANPAAEALAGLRRATLAGTRLASFVSPPDLGRARAYLRGCLDGTRDTGPLEITIHTPDGRSRDLSVRSRAIVEPGFDTYVAMVLRDVTEEREIQRRLVESERLASMGQMAAYVAHEVNTPLTNISLLAAGIHRRSRDSEILDKVEKINIQRRQAANIIADLLSFSRQREPEIAQVDMRDVLTAAMSEVEPYRKPSITLASEWASAPIRLDADPVQLQEVFVNLLKNAFEATPEGRVTLRAREGSGTVVVEVEDTGSGITADVLPRLFEPFFTTKRKVGGTGLGLALCLNIVTSHHGDIRVSSAIGKGSTFTVVLPQERGA